MQFYSLLFKRTDGLYKQLCNKGDMTSSISSVVTIWNVHNLGTECSFVLILRVVHFRIKHLYVISSRSSFCADHSRDNNLIKGYLNERI